MALPAAIPAVASAAGVIYSNLRARREAEKMREFQKEMSSTAWQRAVEDMKKAGINPMVAFSQGGASTPGGAQAPVGDPGTPAAATAIQARLAREQLTTMQATQQQLMGSANREHAQANYWWLMKERAEKENNLGLPEITVNSARAMARLHELQIPGLENIARVESGHVGARGAYLRYILQALGPLNPLLRRPTQVYRTGGYR